MIVEFQRYFHDTTLFHPKVKTSMADESYEPKE